MTTDGSQTMSSGSGSDFVSPAQALSLLKNEEEHDKKFIGVAIEEASARGNEDEEGEFVSPETFSEFENKRSGKFPDTGAAMSSSSSRIPNSKLSEAGSPLSGMQSDLLTRIAGELRTIKSELSSLKDNYDGTARSHETEKGTAAESLTEDKRHLLDSERYEDIKKLLSYLDKLLESLPEDRIDEFARSEYFDLYRKVFEFFELT